jgi:hypothetical protein
MRFDWIWKYTKDGVRDGVYLQLIKALWLSHVERMIGPGF